jgi:hypothetical protein
MKTAHACTHSDTAITALLAQYECPTPFAAARAILMGNIASPTLTLSPVAALEMLWEGKMPVFESADDAQALFDALIGGLWNRLAEHQSSRHPFRLVRAPVAITRAALGALALMRKQEINGFIDGLFGKEERLLLPEKAHRALLSLAEVHAMFAGAAQLLSDPAQLATEQSLAEFAHHAQRMTALAEAEINKAIQACKRARAHPLEPMAAMPTDKRAWLREQDEPPFVESPLSQQLTRNGITVQVDIYGDAEGKWILEVIDPQNNSHVWEEHFVTDQLALAEAIRALEEEPLEFLAEGTSSNEVH